MQSTMAANKSKSMQLLRLEDGDYAKANGGFSLVRAGVKKPPGTRDCNGAVAPIVGSRLNSSKLSC